MKYILSVLLLVGGCSSDGGTGSSDDAGVVGGDTSAATTGSATTGGDTTGGDTTGGDTTGGDTTGGDTAGGDTAGGDTTGGATTGEDLDLDMTAADFDCILEWDKVRRFRVTNKLGKLEETLAVANAGDGGTYPVGTVIQLVPIEAMVKRKAGFSPETNDWEFFFLEASSEGTSIEARGTTDVVNSFGGNCFACHAKAEPKWDFVCEDSHGCDPLPLSPEIIQTIQDSDPRCR
jgi:hypothetical protein